MNASRASAIRQHLFVRGASRVSDLAAAIGASEPTIRRDLLSLEAEGSIERTHGGARLADRSGVEVAFEQREALAIGAKRAIGAAAHGCLRPDTAVFLDAGTTVLQFARSLRLRPMRLRVFTNCLPVAQHLIGVEALTVTLVGGTLRPQNASLVGLLAEAALDRLWFDQLYLGAGAIAADGAITSADEQEARLNARMVARASEVIVLADATKFGRRLTWEVARLGPGMRVFTDSALAAGWRAQLTDGGVALTVVDPP